MPDTTTFEHTFEKPLNAENRRQMLDQKRRYFEAVAGELLEINETVTGSNGNLTVRWRRRA